MSQITEKQTVVVSSSETVANTAAATFAQEIDFRGCIGGMIQIDFQFATAPTANKTLDLYLLPTLTSGTDYDVYSQGRNVLLGSIKVETVTTAQRLSLLVDGVNCPYGKLAIYNNATGQTVTINKMAASVRQVG